MNEWYKATPQKTELQREAENKNFGYEELSKKSHRFKAPPGKVFQLKEGRGHHIVIDEVKGPVQLMALMKFLEEKLDQCEEWKTCPECNE